jgi:hypothetical protein
VAGGHGSPYKAHGQEPLCGEDDTGLRVLFPNVKILHPISRILAKKAGDRY